MSGWLEALLHGLEELLVEASEMHLIGTMGTALYNSLLRGTLAQLPMEVAPKHVAVLKKLKEWKKNELISSSQFDEQCKLEVVAASRPSASSGGAAGVSSSTTPPAPEERACPNATNKPKRSHGKSKAKQKAIAALNQPKLHHFKGISKTLIPKEQLRLQREAALRNEDYKVNALNMSSFPTEDQHEVPALPPVQWPCPKCTRTFSTTLALNNHQNWHREATNDLPVFAAATAPAPAKILPPVGVGFTIGKEGSIACSFRIGSRPYEEVAKEVEAQVAAQAVRQLDGTLQRFAGVRGCERQRRRRRKVSFDVARMHGDPTQQGKNSKCWRCTTLSGVIRQSSERFQRLTKTRGPWVCLTQPYPVNGRTQTSAHDLLRQLAKSTATTPWQ